MNDHVKAPKEHQLKVAAALFIAMVALSWTALGGLSGEAVASGATHVDAVQAELTSLQIHTGAMVYESGLPMPVVRLTFDDQMVPGRNTGSLGRDMVMPTDGISTVAGRVVGGAFRFDGTGRFRLRCQGLPSGNAALSIAAWLSPESHVGGVCSWGAAKAGESVGLSFQSGKGNFFFYGSDLSFDWPVGFVGDGWAHVVCVYDPTATEGRRSVYVNGSLVASDNPSLTPNVNLSPDTSFYLGNVLDVKAKVYKGRMDDFRIYACALSAEQAQMLASGKPQGTDFIPSGVPVQVSGTGVIVNEIGSQTFATLSGNGAVETAEGAKTVVAVESTSDASIELRGAGLVEKTGAGKMSVRRLAVAGLDVKEGEVESSGGCGLARHVVAHWTFDAADPGFDSSGNGYRLVPSKGESTWGDLTSAAPNAVTFAGAADVNVLVLNPFAAAKFASATASTFPSGNAAFTVSVRVKNEAEQRSKNGVYSWGSAAKGRLNGLRTTGDGDQVADATRYGYLHYNWGNDLASDGATLVGGTTVYDNVWDGAWHHVVVTYDPTLPRRRIYLDGALVAEDVPAQMAVDLSDFAIGRSLGSGGNHSYWKGVMDDVLILDCAVAAEQVPLLASGDLSAFAKGASALTVADGATFSVPSGEVVSLASVEGEGTFRIDGTLAIGGVASLPIASMSGSGTVAATGRLHLSSGGTFAGTVAADDGATVTLDVATDEKMSLGRIVGEGTLAKTGLGSVSVSSEAELPVVTTVAAGALEVGATDDVTKPVAHWSFGGERPFEEDGGKEGYSLVPNAGTADAFACDIPGAVKLTGMDYLCLKSCADFPSGDEAFTVSAWIMPERMMDANSYLGVWSWGTPRTARAMNAFTLYHSIPGRMADAPGYQHYAWSADLSVDSHPDDPVFSGDASTWHNVSVTYDPTTRVRALYVDGTLRGRDVLAERLSVATGTKFTVGAALATGTDRPFKGYIGDFAIWRTALGADEVMSRYRAGEGGSDSDVQLTVAEGAVFAVRSGTCAVRSLAGGGDVSISQGAELAFASGGESSFTGCLSGEGTARLAAGARATLAKGTVIGRLVLEPGSALVVDVDGIKEAKTSVVLSVASFEGDENSISVGNLPNAWKVRVRRRGAALIVSAIRPGLTISIR